MGLDDEKMRFSNVIPNSWFRNLKKYAKQSTTKKETTTNTNTPLSSESLYSSSLSAPSATQHQSPKLWNQPRKSYHITRELTQPLPTKKTVKKPDKDFPPVELPRKSLRRRSTKKNRPIPTLPKTSSSSSSPSVSANCTCRSNSPDFTEHDQTSSSELDSMFDDTCKYRHVKNGQFHPELAPIITKNRHHTINIDRKANNIVQEDLPPTRRISTSSTGFKLKTNSPRIANCRRANQTGRKSELSRLGVYESFAVVKTSKNPRRDFRESMVEMILENNMMESSKDLEDLLACYLSLNSHEYHDTIINVFKQIWIDYLHVSLKS